MLRIHETGSFNLQSQLLRLHTTVVPPPNELELDGRPLASDCVAVPQADASQNLAQC